MSEKATRPKRRRRWVWIFLLVVLIPCSWFVYRAERQRSVVHWINSNDGFAYYTYQMKGKEYPDYIIHPPSPAAGLTAAGVDYFSAVVVVFIPEIVDGEWKRIATLTRLRNLHLENFSKKSPVRDLTPLAELWNLEFLVINKHALVSDLAPLAGLKYLRVFKLHGTNVSDLTPLADMEQLEHVYLEGSPVSDLTPLAGLKDLEFLNLDGTKVTDLSPLFGLTNLRQLKLTGTPVSDEQIQNLQKALPGCAIEKTP